MEIGAAGWLAINEMIEPVLKPARQLNTLEEDAALGHHTITALSLYFKRR